MQGGKAQVEEIVNCQVAKEFDGVIAVLKDGAGGIEERVVERDRLRKIYVERANQMFAVDIKI